MKTKYYGAHGARDPGVNTPIIGSIILALASLVLPAAATLAQSGSGLVITGVVDGPLPGGTPKAIELYALEDIADLSVYGLGSANNGGGTNGEELAFPAQSATAGDYLYVASEATQFAAFFGFAPDYIGSAASINGDDAIELFRDGAVVDVFGDINVDGTGQVWEYTDGWTYRIDGTGPGGTAFVPSSWTFSGVNSLDFETTNATAATPFPIATYDADGAGDTPPALSTISPADDATGVALDSSIEVTFSEDVRVSDPWFSLTCDLGGAVMAATSGGPRIYTIAPNANLVADDKCTVTILAKQVTDLDGLPDSLDGDFIADFETVGICGARSKPISSVQGKGDATPLVGKTVRVEGIVTGDFQDGDDDHGDLNGFFVQDPNADGDPATSDGIFVFDDFAPDMDVSPGDRVRVTGTATEFFGETQISATSILYCGKAGSIAPVDVTLPADGVVENADGELIADLERYEGMLVRFAQPLVVTELFNLDRFGELRLAEGGRLFQFTNGNAPDVDGFAAHLRDIARRNITLDDGLTVQNPDPIRYPEGGLTTDNAVRMGDTVAGLTGVLRFSRASGGSGDEAYRLMPTEEPEFAVANPVPDVPEVGGQLKVASFNVLNFFNDLDDGSGACFPSFTDDDCRGADSEREFERQAQKLISALAELDADIYGLVELENDYPDGAYSSIAELTDALNNSELTSCAGRYAYADPDVRVGSDAIAVGLVYCTRTVELATDTTVGFLVDEQLPALGIDHGESVFNGPATSRAPLAATFQETSSGERITVVVNHFKSKGASGLANPDSVCVTDPGADANCDQGDGQGFWNARRTLASQALAAWLATDPTSSRDPDFLLIGDFNAYLQEDPVAAFEDSGFANLVSNDRHGSGQAYSFVFDAQAGALDHAFVTGALARQVTGAAEWHINADEADAIDYNLDFGRDPTLFDANESRRASDHDPFVIGLELAPAPQTKTICAALGDNRKRRYGDWDTFRFHAGTGEQVEARLLRDPHGRSTGTRAALVLYDAVRGVKLLRVNTSALPNRISASLPGTGQYRILVMELSYLARRRRFRGEYCVVLKSSGAAASTLRATRSVE
ncbi:MAG: ExeM/NucH family extracellular endonuclease [Gammaproteobacteria bacterium]